MKIKALCLVLLLALALPLAGCQSETTPEGPAAPIAEGDAYRDFTAPLADGGEFTLSDHEGKVILLNFWATWCGPCVGEMPAFERLQETYGEDLALVAVNSRRGMRLPWPASWRR